MKGSGNASIGLLHSQPLGSTFMLTLTPTQVPGWTREQLLSFWQRWYVPANATLFVVGDFDRSVPQIVEMIEKLFGPIPAGQQDLPPDMAPRPAELPDSGPASSSGSNGAPAPSSRRSLPVPSLDSLDYLTEQRGKVAALQAGWSHAWARIVASAAAWAQALL